MLELAWTHANAAEERIIKAFETGEKYDKEDEQEKAREMYEKALELSK